MMSNTKLIFGAGLIGVTIGMLLAPKKGTELQASIFDSINELREETSEIMEKIRGITEKVTTKSMDIKNSVETKVEHVKDGIDDLKTTGDHLSAIFS